MTELQKLKQERNTLRALYVSKKVEEYMKQAKDKGLTDIVWDLVTMAVDSELRAETAEMELRECKKRSIIVNIPGRL